MSETYYDLLGLPPTADAETIKKAYRAKMREVHPDTAPPEAQAAAEALAKRINTAYAVLSDAGKRAAYDAKLRREQPEPAQVPQPSPFKYKGEYAIRRGESAPPPENTPPPKPDHPATMKVNRGFAVATGAFLVMMLALMGVRFLASGDIGAIGDAAPCDTAVCFAAEGDDLRAEGDLEGAEIAYLEALALEPATPRAFLGLARLYVTRWDVSGSDEDRQAALIYYAHYTGLTGDPLEDEVAPLQSSGTDV